MINITALDHLVLTVGDVDEIAAWYERVLGMRRVEFAGGRQALAFGQQKINLHPAAAPFAPCAAAPQRGSADLCFLTDTPLDQVVEHLEACGVSVIQGPVMRTGAMGPIHSVYLRDPEGSLIEVANAV